MKIDFNTIKTALLSRFTKEPAGKKDEILLERDWALLALGLVCALFLAVSFGVYAFYMTISDEYLGASDTGSVSTKTLSRARLNNAIEAYDARVGIFERLKRTRPTTPAL